MSYLTKNDYARLIRTPQELKKYIIEDYNFPQCNVNYFFRRNSLKNAENAIRKIIRDYV